MTFSGPWGDKRPRCWWAAALALALAVALLAGPAAAQPTADSPPAVQLSEAERAWLAAHPRIRVFTKTEWAPIDLYTYEGQFRGLSGDYLGLIAQRLGVQFQFTRAATLADALAALERGEAELLPSVARTPVRERFMAFSQPYLDVPNIYVARRDVTGVGPQSSMAGLRIAAERGYGVGLILRERHPQALIVEFDDSAAALRAVSEGQADAYLGALPTTSFLVEKLLLTNLEVRSPSHHSQSALHFGVRKEDALLRSIIDKALATITLAERQAIHRRWVPLHSLLAEASPQLRLGADEQALMRSMPALRVGYEADYRPYTFRGDDGQLAGMANDYLRLLADKIGLPLGAPQGGVWSEIFEGARSGRIDLLVAVAANEERAREFLFVGPWISTPNVLITPQGAPPALDLLQYAGRKVAVLRAGQTAFLLSRQQPRIELVEVATRDDLLAAVLGGQADAAFVNATFAAERLAAGMGSALKMAGFFPELNSDLYFGVRRDQPQLAALLARALASLSEAERAAIGARWAVLPGPEGLGADARATFRRLAPALGVLIAALLVSLLWGVWLHREVSRRRRAERALLGERDRAEGLARARHDFLALASHEIRTPVNAVLGALGQLPAGLPARERELVALAERAALRLSQYVNNLLDLSKSDAGELRLVRQPESLAALLQDALAAVQPMAREAGLALELAIDPRLAPQHEMDAFRMHQVLLNLLANAVKFGERGTVRLEARLDDDAPQAADAGRAAGMGEGAGRRARSGANAGDRAAERVRIGVRDEGSGIAPEDLPLLFRAYAQSGDSLTHRRGGTGLGLALCKRLVEAMDGQIGIESAPGRGTLVTVLLDLVPAAHAPAHAAAPAVPAAVRGAPLRVLLVEDDRVQQIVLETMLCRAGCQVDLAGSAEQAQALWSGERHALVLTDLQLPGLGGLEFARWLRAQPGGGAVQLVATSADLGDAEAARAAGIERLLQKPVPAPLIERLVAEARAGAVLAA